MQDWDKLRLFTAVADRGSFSEAARSLNMSQPALSRQIRALEEELGLKLFHRHARGTVLTHDGEMLYARTADFAKIIESTRRRMSESGESVRGQLTVAMTMSFGTQWLVPRLPRFQEAYPDVELELYLSDGDITVGEGEAEMAIRFQPSTHADDIQRPMMTLVHKIYASQDYIDQHGAPQTVDDLDHHRLISYGPHTPAPIRNVDWILGLGRPPNQPRASSLMINNVPGIRRAVQAGLGIAAMPEYIVSDTPDLVPILQAVNGPDFQSYIIYPSALKRARRIQAFRDFMLKEAAQFRAEHS